MSYHAHAIRLIAAGTLFLALGGMCAAAVGQSNAHGLWLTDTGDGVVQISSCGGRLCAHLYAILDPKVPKGARDVYNQKQTLRTRPICGLPIMGNLQQQGPTTWGNGWVYDPKVGKTYDVEIEVRGPQTLVVHGYIGVKFVGKTVTWVRANGSVPRCTR
jgi:uncharacterized protein (DUF2147 family)